MRILSRIYCFLGAHLPGTWVRVQESDRPQVEADPTFRSKVRELLVTLGNAPGLGVVVRGIENVVTVFPRAGRSMSTLGDLLGMEWREVEYSGPGRMSDFLPMDKEAVEKLLKSLSTATEDDT